MGMFDNPKLMAVYSANKAWKEIIKKRAEERKKNNPKFIRKQKCRELIEKRNFYYTEAWRILRYDAFKLYGRKCAVCGAAGKGIRLHVDHIKPRSKYPELELRMDNLQILCEECNMGKSNRDETDWRSL